MREDVKVDVFNVGWKVFNYMLKIGFNLQVNTLRINIQEGNTMATRHFVFVENQHLLIKIIRDGSNGTSKNILFLIILIKIFISLSIIPFIQPT